LRATTRGEDFRPVRALVKSDDPVGRIAALAPAIIRRARQGHRQAQAIVQAGQALLAAQALAVARQLRLPAPVALSWAGSVLSDPWFLAGLRRALARGGLRARWRAPALEPVAAAAGLARQLAAGHADGV
jgi:N-acetylglucosamine kinase-like BadF-type ATPase